ncbi:hypothetical protein [Marilutibacter alkalisoli]|uniref:Uncharacterized protein n=1 Tax=Marilutibacter alkalisoli TaxID=2591633 RepID=A0A514BPF4_9GAMM|nr:hypothetical protein [Lysobacter alkalisoli]QDH69215.1 hypothetical protein FKV23_03210 [Lysobacter alkalisoli]
MLALVLTVAMSVAAGGARAGGNAGDEDVYLVDLQLQVSNHGSSASLRQKTLNAVSQRTDGAGRITQRVRLLWMKMLGGGYSKSTLELDMDDPDDAEMARVLGAGFELSLDAKGRVLDLSAVDKVAWERITTRNPRMAQQFDLQQATGMRPFVLPKRLRRGQRLRFVDNLSGADPMRWELQVLQLSAGEAFLDVRGESGQLQVEGRQVVRRHDGLPLEAWLRLLVPSIDDEPEVRTRLYMVNLRHLPGLGSWLEHPIELAHEHERGYESLLAEPPFAGEPDEGEGYELDPQVEGRLLPWMLDGADLAGMQRGLVMMLKPADYRHSRPTLALGAQLAPPQARTDAPAMRPLVMGRLTGSELLDRSGQPLQGVESLPIALGRSWLLNGGDEVDESAQKFPLRLPLDLKAEALQALDRVRLSLEVETYAWDGAETVAAGQQPRHGEAPRIVWAGRRLTLKQPPPADDPDSGFEFHAVPLDASGRQIPHARLFGARPDEETAPLLEDVPRLSWERRRFQWVVELAAAEPVAAVRLYRYRSTRVPQQWDFRNIDGMTEGGTLVGTRHAADPGILSDFDYVGQAALASFEVASIGYPYPPLQAKGTAAAQALRFCAVESVEAHAGVGVEPVPPGQLWDEVLNSAGGGWRLRFDEQWYEDVDRDWPEQWPLNVQCPVQVQVLREDVADSRCFEAAGDGWLQVRQACRGRIDSEGGTLVARDADGLPLAPLPADAREHALRFWGEPVEVEYTLRDSRVLRRQVRLPRSEGATMQGW